jgi:hypothetical protein
VRYLPTLQLAEKNKLGQPPVRHCMQWLLKDKLLACNTARHQVLALARQKYNVARTPFAMAAPLLY